MQGSLRPIFGWSRLTGATGAQQLELLQQLSSTELEASTDS